MVQFLDHDARRSAATSIRRRSSGNTHELIEFSPAIAFRDPPNDVERCPPAYRRVVGRASRQQSFKHCGSTSSSIHEANDTAPERCSSYLSGSVSLAFQIDELVKCGAWIFHARMTDGLGGCSPAACQTNRAGDRLDRLLDLNRATAAGHGPVRLLASGTGAVGA